VTAAVSLRVCSSTWTSPTERSPRVAQAAGASAGDAKDYLDPLPSQLSLELVRCSVGDLPPLVDDHDAVGEPVRFLHVLGHQENGGSTSHERLDRFPHLGSATRI